MTMMLRIIGQERNEENRKMNKAEEGGEGAVQ
jgi:hypothetical protein